MIGEYSKLSNGVCNLDLTLNSHRKCKEKSMENMHTDEGRRGLISVSKESVSNTSNCLSFVSPQLLFETIIDRIADFSVSTQTFEMVKVRSSFVIAT